MYEFLCISHHNGRTPLVTAYLGLPCPGARDHCRLKMANMGIYLRHLCCSVDGLIAAGVHIVHDDIGVCCRRHMGGYSCRRALCCETQLVVGREHWLVVVAGCTNVGAEDCSIDAMPGNAWFAQGRLSLVPDRARVRGTRDHRSLRTVSPVVL